ncbi:hypothetical protein [uncultured Variovorax sp.]|nr:hypothetical protein [uncultured Variovorax sp.]
MTTDDRQPALRTATLDEIAGRAAVAWSSGSIRRRGSRPPNATSSSC